MEKVSKKISREIIKKVFFPLIILLFFIGCLVYYKTNIAPFVSAAVQADLRKYIFTIFILCISFVLQRILSGILSWYIANVTTKTATELDDKLVPLVRRSVNLIIWVVAFLLILPLYGVNISALIATLGVTSLAIALAAQDTISNIIAGFLIMIDAPFEIGDRIKLPSGEIVKVLDIGVRRSKFLSEDKAIIIVPNLDLSKSRITNYTHGKKRRNKINR